MKKLLYSSLFILSSSFAFGQTWNWASANTNKSSGSYVDPIDGVCDNSGNVYETGEFAGPVSFGSLNFSAFLSDPDVYLVKYSKSGTPLWGVAPVIGGYALGISVATNDSGDVCLAGYYTETMTIGSYTFPRAVNYNMFIAVFDSLGTLKWGANSSAGYVISNSVTMDNKGNVYVAGYFTSSATLGSFNLVGSGSNCLLLAKYNNTGNVVWVTTSKLNTFTTGNTVVTDTAGNIYVAGQFIDSLSIGVDTFTTKGDQDVFLSKFDPSGNLIWLTTAICPNNVCHAAVYGLGGRFLSIDKHSDLYWSGWFADSVEFGGYTLTSRYHSGYVSAPYLVKYSPAGNILWANQGFNNNSMQPYSISGGNYGHDLFLCGYFNDSLRFNSITVKSDSGSPSFLFEFDSSGTAICASVVDNDNDDNNAVAADPTGTDAFLLGDVAVTTHNDTAGCYFGSIYLTGSGNEFSFVGNFDCSTTTGTNELIAKSEELRVYPNPNNGLFTIAVKNEKLKVKNIAVFDVFGQQVYSQLTIRNSPFTIDLATQPSGIYFYRVLDEGGGLIGEGKVIIQK